MEVEEGYYIPKKEEFVEGFNYQLKETHYYMLLDKEDGSPDSRSEDIHTWYSHIVPFKRPDTGLSSIKDGEFTVHTSNSLLNFLFREPDWQLMIDKGLVRAKIKKHVP